MGQCFVYRRIEEFGDVLLVTKGHMLKTLKSVRFTKHARERFTERWPGFPLSAARRILSGAEYLYDTPIGKTYYKSNAYIWVVKETENQILVITLYKS